VAPEVLPAQGTSPDEQELTMALRSMHRHAGPARLAGFLAAAFLVGAAAVALAAVPELPRAYVDTSLPASPGRTIAVAAGGDFQSALDAAQPGDVITLAAGATFTGNFVLPNKSGTGWIVIRTSAPDGSLPVPGTRITPADAAALPKVVTANSNPAIATAAGAHHYRLIGLEVSVAAGVASNNGLVALGSGVQSSLEQIPHDIVLDRLYIHGNASVNLRRGVALNSASTAVIDSYVAEAHDRTYDAQALCGWNGPGPYKIVNNYLEGAAENVLFGGADPTITNLVPSDIEIRGNHFFKPLSWRLGDPSYAGIRWVVKNLFELKNAQRLLIDGNVFEQNWEDAQNGMAILFTVRNQDGHAPWSVVQDVTFTNNLVRHAAGGIQLLGVDTNFPSQRTSRVWIRNNVFEDVDGARWGGRGRLFAVLNGTADLVIEHVTGLQSGDVLGADWAPNTGFVFRDNIVADNGYGVVADRSSLEALATYFPGATFVNNALAGGSPADYPPGNFFPPAVADVGFVDLAAGDYHLAAFSPYRAAGTDGKDLGADVDALQSAIGGSTSSGGGGGTTVTGADLAVTAVGNPPSFGALGGTFTVGVTVQNQGDLSASSSTTRYYLSADRQKSSADTQLTGNSSVPSLVAGASSTKTVTLTIPSTTALGSYFLLACADAAGAVTESDETNNCAASATMIQITRPDLVEVTVSNPPASVSPGGSFAVTDTVRNQGSVASKSSTTRFYLSADQQKGSTDKRLTGNHTVPALAPGASATKSATVTVPTSVPPGTYYLLACADDGHALVELDEANNCRAAASQVTVGP
jgi:hypothetical protein